MTATAQTVRPFAKLLWNNRPQFEFLNGLELTTVVVAANRSLKRGPQKTLKWMR